MSTQSYQSFRRRGIGVDHFAFWADGGQPALYNKGKDLDLLKEIRKGWGSYGNGMTSSLWEMKYRAYSKLEDDKTMSEDQIVEKYVSGKLTDSEAVRLLIEAGSSERDANYQIKSLQTIDVR